MTREEWERLAKEVSKQQAHIAEIERENREFRKLFAQRNNE